MTSLSAKPQNNTPPNPKPIALFPVAFLSPPPLKSVYQPKKHLPQPSLHPPSCIPKPIGLPKFSKPLANASLPCVEQLLQHLSAINSPAPIQSVNPMLIKLPLGTRPVPSTPDTLEKIGVERPPSTSVINSIQCESKSSSDRDSPCSTCSAASTVSTRLLRPRLPITFNEAALS